jgi:hypothetical protein
MWVGKYYVYEWTTPFTYPDTVNWYWTPLWEGEQPFTIIVMVD